VGPSGSPSLDRRELKKRLAENPAVVLREHGIQVPTGTELRLVENTDKVAYITLPARPSGNWSELSVSELENVAGGLSYSCEAPCYACTPTCIVIGPITLIDAK
jgi:hypothetical protein